MAGFCLPTVGGSRAESEDRPLLVEGDAVVLLLPIYIPTYLTIFKLSTYVFLCIYNVQIHVVYRQNVGESLAGWLKGFLGSARVSAFRLRVRGKCRC